MSSNQAEKHTLTSELIWILAIGCGVTVANLYYSQPLLAQMAKAWHSNEANMGSMAALTMSGYGTGLLLFVPLGDIFDRRTLILSFLAAVIAVLCGLASAPNLTIFAICTFLVGCLTIIPQLIIPLATGLAKADQRGSIVGKLMSGLLLGILVSRTVGGFIGEQAGWRAVYWSAAAINAILLLVLFIRLPKCQTKSKIHYLELLRTLWQIASKERMVQSSAFFGAMTFAAFNAFWTTLSFFTSLPPYNLDAEKIGLFGLVGASGVLAAPIAGRLADSRGPLFGIGFSLILMIFSWGVLWYFGLNYFGLIAGIVFLDMAAHASQVSNMARIYVLPADLHSRVNTIYMTSYFVGGSLGAWVGAQAWARFGWAGVCCSGALFPLIGLLIFVITSISRSGKAK